MMSLLEACVQLNRRPWTMGPEIVARLRDNGFSDEAIHDAFQVVAYFAYINRIADELEPDMPAKPEGWMRAR